MKRFHYTDIDGEHFPDASLGDNLFYGLDFSPWLENEADSLVSVEWDLPDGITSDDDFVQGTVGNVKLQASRTGSFRIGCILTSTETMNQAVLQQQKSIDMILKVY